jgi:tetratricopeptide (TPR) repeat protein
MKKYLIVFGCIFTIILFKSFGTDPFEVGKELYSWNRFDEAKQYFEEALRLEPGNEEIISALALSYIKLQEFDNAILLLQRTMNTNNSIDKSKLYVLLGVCYFGKDEKKIAEEMYTQAIILNKSFAQPYLSRANVRVGLKEYEGAISDYEHFLVLKPFTEQRPQIEAMIAALRGYLEEQEKLAQEQKEKEEKLLNEILESLENASEETKDLSVDSDIILEEEEEEIGIDE